MRFGTLSQRHPCCDPDLFERYDALYRGGRAFARRLERFLNKNPLEGGDVYALRKKEAFYRSYVGPIVDFFGAQLFSAPFTVRTSEEGKSAAPELFYADFREDVDLAGTDLATFMKARFITAMVKGCAWWVAEMPDDAGLPAMVRADWEARGLGRVRLCPLEPEDVLDWETDEYGGLKWVITHRKEQRRDDPRLDRTLTTETWKLYDAQNVETFQIVYDHRKKRLKAEDEIPSLGSKAHRFPRVPLVQMCLPEGLWLLNRAADAQLEHFRLSVAASWAVKRTCYPMAVFHAEDDKDLPPMGAGYVQRMGLLEKLEWVSPGTESFDVLREEINGQVREIYRISQQMAHSVDNSAAALDRSGDSKSADNEATEICLLAYATEVKAATETTFELVSDGREDFDVKFSIEGMTHFNLDDVTTALANLQVALGLRIPSPTLTRELSVKASDLVLPDASQATKDAIRAEIEKAAAEPKPAPAPPAPPGADKTPPGGEQSPDQLNTAA